jgi:hypothetical protein
VQIAWSIPAWGWALLLAAAIACLAWAWRQYRRTDPQPSARLRRLLTALRAATLLLLLLALAGPSLLRVRHLRRPAEFAILVDDSASMRIADGSAGMTRWRRALRLGAAADSVLKRRDPQAHVTWLRGNGIGPARPFDPAGPDTAGPSEAGSDLDGMVRDATGRWTDRPLRGLLLLTDGNSTEAGNAPGTVGEAAAPPLFVAAGVGDPEGPPDRLIQELRYPDTVYQGDSATVEVTVATRGGTGQAQPATVRLRQGGAVIAERTAPAPAGGVITLDLSLRPAEPGLQVYDLELAPLDNERFLANNRATLAVDVRKGRSRVLLLAGRPGWDSRFLAQAVAAEERLALTVVRRGRDGLVLADSGRAWTSPRKAAGWRRWDGVALAGWVDLQGAVDWPSLAAAVDGGLGLLVIPTGGEESPTGVGAVAPVPQALAELLPVDPAGAIWQSGEWLARPTATGSEHPLLAGVTAGVAPGAGLDNGRFPPLVRLLAAPVRPEAETLLVAAPLRSASAPAGVPLLAVRQLGSGRVTWFGGRRLWELAFWEPPVAVTTEGSHPGRRLLRNLMIWTASGAEQTGLRLVGHRQIYQEGEAIRLEAEWRDLRGEPVTDRPQALVLRPLDGMGTEERTFSLAPVAGAPGHAVVTLPPLQPGRYAATPISGDEPRQSGPAQRFVVAAQSVEAVQTRQDRRALRALAGRLDGAYLAGEAPDATARLAALVERVPEGGDVRTVRRRWDPWAGWPLLAGVFGLLGVEWVLRRAQGML